MKRIFTLLAVAMTALSSMATDYTDSLTVTVNGVVSEQHATVSVAEGADGLLTFSLKNFVLEAGGTTMPVGNIVIDGLTPTAVGTDTLLVCSRNISITDGDTPGVDMWIGSMLGDVPIKLVAKLAKGRAYASISIDMVSMGQVIDVTFGSGYQIPNSGFESYHTYSMNKGKINIDEPVRWHSFATAGGRLNSLVMGTPHTFQSDDVRPGSNGSTSLSVKSATVMGFIANGTVTTGRMIAGAMTATDPKNHAELDMSNTDLDGNGNPYYVEMLGQPDSLAVWLKFSQGKANAAHPYATVSAYITDGTYFQDPQDKAYTNVLAKAQNNTIATTDGEWKRIAIPFDYVNEDVDGKAILVTISTNADAGEGSANDEILIDDFELIYDATLVDITRDGDEVKPVLKGRGAFAVVSYDKSNPSAYHAVIDVYSADLKKHSVGTYVFTPTGIANVATDGAVRKVYNLGGQRVNTMKTGEVYIVKEGGKTYKVQK